MYVPKKNKKSKLYLFIYLFVSSGVRRGFKLCLFASLIRHYSQHWNGCWPFDSCQLYVTHLIWAHKLWWKKYTTNFYIPRGGTWSMHFCFYPCGGVPCLIIYICIINLLSNNKNYISSTINRYIPLRFSSLQSSLFFTQTCHIVPTKKQDGSRNRGENFTFSRKIWEGSICNKAVSAGIVSWLDFHLDNVTHKYF